VVLDVERQTGSNAQPVTVSTVTAPAAVLEQGFQAATVFLSPALAARLGAAPGQAAVYAMLAHPASGPQVDAADAAVNRVTGQTGGSLLVEDGRPQRTRDLLLAGIVLGAALLAAAASITAGGLALADSRADLATLAAVGGPPRVRRRLAAAQAGVLTLLGCVLGVGAGFLPGWSMVHSTAEYLGGRSRPTPLAVPWTQVGLLTVGLPLVTALVVGLAVRSRIPLNRRAD
jgi:putative ABC transport system permease protein